LALATSSLLAATAPVAVNASEQEFNWEFDSSILLYSEKDRVSVAEPVISAKRNIGTKGYFSIRLVVDSLTGSSPNGAPILSTAQTFATPSGEDYTTEANTTPLDSSFKDTRGAMSLEWKTSLSDTMTGTFGANISGEFDYFSVGGSSTFTWDYNQHNTTVAFGLSYNYDLVKPVGDIPVGLSVMSTSKSRQGNDDTKKVFDMLFSVTQVINRKTLMQFNYTYGSDSGYLTDPYKILAVLDGTGNLRGTNPYLYEHRPGTRKRNALFWKTVYQVSPKNIARFSYRYYWDDWGINSHTFNLRYRMSLGGKHYIQPHVRYYFQDKADFYHYTLTDGTIPQYASADYRLGNLNTTTFGLKYGVDFGKSSHFSMRVEKLTQTVDSSDLIEDLKAVLFQINYSVNF